MYCMSVEGCPPKQLGSFWKSSPSKQLPPTLNPTLFMGEALALSMPSTQRTRGSRIVSSKFQYLPHEVFWQSSFPPGGAKPWREFECMSPLQTTCALNVNLCELLDSPEQTTRRQDMTIVVHAVPGNCAQFHLIERPASPARSPPSSPSLPPSQIPKTKHVLKKKVRCCCAQHVQEIKSNPARRSSWLL